MTRRTIGGSLTLQALAQLHRPATLYRCNCGWRGREPSWSDASEEMIRPDGRVDMDRRHLPICPRCLSVAEPDSTNEVSHA